MINKNRRPKVSRDLDKFDIEQDTIGQLIKENEQLRENSQLLEQQLEKQRVQINKLEDELSEMPAISLDDKIEKVNDSEHTQYEYLLEQYHLEHEKNERLFKQLFLKQENGAISLLEKAELADVLIDAKNSGKKIIQNAEAEARNIQEKVIKFLHELVENEDSLSSVTKSKIKERIDYLSHEFLIKNQQGD